MEKKAKKVRIDQHILDINLVETRERGKSEILAGNVFVNDERVDKPGALISADSVVRIVGKVSPYVSRGGLKLEKALKYFGIDLKDARAIDIGASTGGFTDCMLQSGAASVCSVDVGYGQLAWKLRQDSRVCVMEKVNARNLKPDDFNHAFDFATIDVSFISLDKILPPLYNLLENDASCICLIKPQFEAGRDKVGKKGVIKSQDVQVDVINRMVSIASNIGYVVLGLTYSPIRGPEGNIEFLMHLGMPSVRLESTLCNIEEMVQDAHSSI